jgi:hypothetical protein
MWKDEGKGKRRGRGGQKRRDEERRGKEKIISKC